MQHLETGLNNFATILDSDEVLLFERATFLVRHQYPQSPHVPTHPHLPFSPCSQVIAKAVRRPHTDVHRFEKISNIVKQFKLSCSKLQAQFQSMEVRNSCFASFIDVFTPNTYIMVIMSDPEIRMFVCLFVCLFVL